MRILTYHLEVYYFSVFATSILNVGDAADTNAHIKRGSADEKNFAYLCLKDDVLHAAIFIARPITEIKAAESLIVNHVNLKLFKDKLVDITFTFEIDEITSDHILASSSLTSGLHYSISKPNFFLG